MKMHHYFVEVLKKYFVFSGRARRAEYWYFVLGTYVYFFLGGIAQAILLQMPLFKPLALLLGFFLVFMLYFGLLIPAIAVGVRRLHDSNKSGWWLLVPLYNLYLLIRRGTEGDNFYGPDPKAPPVPLPDPVAMPTPTPPTA